MGAFLDKPVVDKATESGQLPDGSLFAHSSMQGWRTSQEDAHTCAPDFDSAHPGRHLFAVFDGHGGAEVARYLSESLPQYLSDTSTYQEGDFEQALKDAFLGLDAKLLQPEVAATLKRYAKEGANAEDSDPEAMAEEALTLREEAEMPLDNLLKRFRGVAAAAAAARRRPVIGGNGDSEDKDNKDDKSEARGEEKEAKPDSANAGEGASQESAANGRHAAANEEAASTSREAAAPKDADEEEEEEDEEEKKDKDYIPGGESKDEEEEDEEEESEGDAAEDEEEGQEGDDDEEDEEEDDDDDDDDDDEEDESESDEEYEVIMPCGDDPGVDSGCTAVVALVVGKQLYVANAGDSRAVLSEAGKAVDMSEDHKPEDEEEKKRIEAAGGHVTREGRVNGGLNLSRALGDHAYKQNAELSAAKQIISPLPDVRTVTLTDSHRFLLLACDGIWNSMSSQDAVDFCEKRLEAGLTPARTCEALLDHCLAPDARDSDGTGCDNMTAVLICFQPAASGAAARKRPLPAGQEDVASADNGDTGENDCKRVKEG